MIKNLLVKYSSEQRRLRRIERIRELAMIKAESAYDIRFRNGDTLLFYNDVVISPCAEDNMDVVEKLEQLRQLYVEICCEREELL